MTASLFFLLITFILLGAFAAVVFFWRSRKILREDKNFERGLKMVPLLIQLPPISEDLEGSGRDARDLMDENISRAQIIYNILASSAKKGMKSNFYGQRHIALEIIASGGFVYFYAAVPVPMIPLVEQAIVSAYPSARIEEASEHNIFSPVGRMSGTVGGELTLKEHFAYPIATYQDLKRDALQSLLNALSTLDKEDGAGIQFLIRPAKSDWRKKANAVAGKKRKGKGKKKGFELGIWWLQQLFTALAKPPENKDDKKDTKELSSLEQSVVDSIDDKTRHAGFEVLIRLAASSNMVQRSQVILSNMVAAFALYDAPGKNGFKFVSAKDIESFVTGFIMRFFPQESTKTVLNAVELASLFHFPDQKNIPTSQLERQQSKQVDGPRNIPNEGILLGYNLFRGAKKPIRIANEDRRRHMYVVGQTGTGKSTFLENLALQDMLTGNGFAFVDPHGDTAEKLLGMVPKERTEDVIYFSPADMDYPLGLNLFEFHNAEQKDFLIQEAINMLYKLYDPTRQGIIGPRYEHLFRNAALTVMADPEGGTFIDIPKLFRDPKYVEQKLKHVKDSTVIEFWKKEMPQSQRSSESGEVLAWFVSKFGAFLSNEMMRNIIGQTKSAFDLRDIMDNKKILLVNLSKGRTGELNSKLLGMIFVMKFQAAAMSRATVPEDQRTDFCLYVDEFQNFSTDSFATIMSEARKYHLNLIVANQFTTQLTEEIRDAVFGNMGTIVSFRIGQNDVESLSRYYQPLFDGDDLLRVPNFNTIVRTLIGGVPTQPFSMSTLPSLGTSNQQLADALKQLSAAKYGRPKADVESEIFDRLETKEEPKPSFGFGGQQQLGGNPFGQQASPSFQSPVATQPAKPSTGSSFLDEWLTKRSSQTTMQPPLRQPAAQLPVDTQSPSVQQRVPFAPPAFTNQQPFSQSSQAMPLGSPAKEPQAQPLAETVSNPNPTDNNDPLNALKGFEEGISLKGSGSSEGSVQINAAKSIEETMQPLKTDTVPESVVGQNAGAEEAMPAVQGQGAGNSEDIKIDADGNIIHG